jgi:hypothetical protein
MTNPENDSVKVHILDGKGFRAKFIPLDLISIGLFALIVRFFILDFGDNVVQNQALLYWGFVAGISFSLYMATTRITLRRMASSLQAVSILGDYMEGSRDEVADFALAVQSKGVGKIERPKSESNFTKVKYEINDNGNEILTVS